MHKIKIKQNNKCLRSIFFANKRHHYTLLEILKLENVFKFKMFLSLIHKILYLKKKHPLLSMIWFYLPLKFITICQYARNQILYKPASRTNYDLANFRVAASKIREKIPVEIKCLPHCAFKNE